MCFFFFNPNCISLVDFVEYIFIVFYKQEYICLCICIKKKVKACILDIILKNYLSREKDVCYKESIFYI